MELLKEMTHMEIEKVKGNVQAALEEDINLAENKEDVEKILLVKGDVKIEEVKNKTLQAFVKGKLLVNILYKTQNEEIPLQSLTTSIPFTEEIYLDGLESGDQLYVQGELEDISVSLINSRKLNIRTLIIFSAKAMDMIENEISIDYVGDSSVICQKENIDYLELANHKKDIFHIRQEVELPQQYPNIGEIIWQDIKVNEINYKTLNDRIAVKGEMAVHIAYMMQDTYREEEAEEDQQKVYWYDSTFPFQGEISFSQSNEKMIANIQYHIFHSTMDIRQDIDREDRIVSIDVSLELDISLYEPKSIDILKDAYSVKNEVNCKWSEVSCQELITQRTENISVKENINLEQEEIIDQIRLATCACKLETIRDGNKADGDNEKIKVQGFLHVEILYEGIKEDIEMMDVIKKDFPFEIPVSIKEAMDCKAEVEVNVLQMFVSQVNKNHIDIEISIQAQIFICRKQEYQMVEEMTIEPLDYEKRRNIPGMVIYYVQDQDNLWKIGKKYYLDVEKIKECNGLTGDTIKKGDKLLLLKSGV